MTRKRARDADGLLERTIALRIDRRDGKRVDRLIARTGLTASEIVRLLLRGALDEQDREGK